MQALLPKSAKLADPGVDLLKRFRIHRINSPRPFGAHSDETAFTQGTKVLRNAGLRDAEFSLDDVGETTGAALAACEEFQNPAPDWIAEDVKSMHDCLPLLQLWPV